MKQMKLFRLMYYMLAYRKLTAERLADFLEISVRSVYRYIDELSLNGVPIRCQKGKNGGIFLDESFTLPANYFTEAEFQILTDSLVAVQATGTRTIAPLLEKLNALRSGRQRNTQLLRTDMLLIDHSPWGKEEHSERKLQTFETAILQSRLVQIEYHDAQSRTSRRVIEPHLLLLKQSQWYIYAFCRSKNAFRLFKLNRIVNLFLHEEAFRRKPIDRTALDLEQFLEKRPLLSVEFQFDREILTDMEEWLSVERVFRIDEQTYGAKAELYSDFYLRSKILSMGKHLIVLAPLSLKDELRQEVQFLMQNYGQDEFIRKKGCNSPQNMVK